MLCPKLRPKQRKSLADITLILEGTYPFIRGGVSNWVHQLILGLPQFSFSLVFIGSTKNTYQGLKYELPDNVVHLEDHYLFEPMDVPPPKARPGHRADFEAFSELHELLRSAEGPLQENDLTRALSCLGKSTRVADFFHSIRSWDYISDQYDKSNPDNSFVDYFWTIRSIHQALFRLADIARKTPRPALVHAISTGYAGFLASLLRLMHGCPLVLTEHGIYTKERKIDLQSMHLQDRPDTTVKALTESGMRYHHELWIKWFQGLGKITYACADPIIALSDGNRQRQVRDGADAKRCIVIPNGVEIERYRPLRTQRPAEVPLVLGLIGRIVEIKDIKTFIRGMRSVTAALPTAEGWLIGPEEEDAAYVQECKDLVNALGLQNRVKFLGFQKIEDVLPKLGLVVLTSISEAFPLVIVEAYASGVPFLATDVGACRDLIEGNDAEDRSLGRAGDVVTIADPETFAQAAIALLTDEKRWQRAQSAAIERVERYYDQTKILARYGEIYTSKLRH